MSAADDRGNDAPARRHTDGPEFHAPGELADNADLIGIVRRYERFATDVDQRLKDIVLLLQTQRSELLDERARIDKLETDVAEHLKPRRRAARK